MDQEIQREKPFQPFSINRLNEKQKQAVNLLWERGNLDFLLHPGQKRMLASFEGKSFGCASTSRQIGKSFGAVAYCIAKPTSHILCSYIKTSHRYRFQSSKNNPKFLPGKHISTQNKRRVIFQERFCPYAGWLP